MMFDNTPPPPQSTLSTVLEHIPIVVAIGAALVFFIGMHTAATTVVALAAVHLAGATMIIGFRRLRAESKEASP